ncbi:hypothetical protein NMSP_1257 [Candidatus Nitrosomarinus catalina]|uniref:Uncharacterized protein n=1 Tax=Candidatus Nitrosomarinus catalinensis TaxID=1898749 RepID=A0A2Z2HLK2_9ARCH|nr:hypothetical protein [Candidatus Nitrosomarinus catalina]ARS64872.1 hypothetical protein NMSP_1257 [Candidatus Nitrosomarinus catalina]
MSNEDKSKFDFNTRDVGRILLSFGTLKVGFDGNVPGVSDFYSKFKGSTRDRTSFFSGCTDKDIFIYAMCIGKQKGLKNEYLKGENGKIDRKDHIDMEYFKRDPEYLWMMLATALTESRDLESGEPTLDSFEPKNVLKICEEYANAGITFLMKMNNECRPTDPYSAYEEKLKELLDDS